MRDPRTRARTRRDPAAPPLTWDRVVASLLVMLVVPVGLVAVSYPVLAAAAATGAVLPGIARRAMD